MRRGLTHNNRTLQAQRKQILVVRAILIMNATDYVRCVHMPPSRVWPWGHAPPGNFEKLHPLRCILVHSGELVVNLESTKNVQSMV